jgi:hypothetical protein
METLKKIMAQLQAFIRKHLIPIGTLVTILCCIYLYLKVVSNGQDMGNNFTLKSEIISLRDTVIGTTKTAYLYDSVNKIGIFIHPLKYKDTYTYQRVVSQLKMVKNRASAHSKVIDYFIINLYYFILIQTVFMVIVCLLGLVISKKGGGIPVMTY